MKTRATEQTAQYRQKPANSRNQDTKPQPGSATPDKGFPKGNCPASERKPRSSARKRLDRQRKSHTLPKGSVNHGQAATG